MADEQQDDKTNTPVAEQGEGSEAFTDEGSSGEAWRDELPPEDDFHDADAEEEAEPVEEEIEDDGTEEAPGVPYEEDDGEEESGAGDKKRGKSVLFGVLGVGVLLVGGLAYVQFGLNGVKSSILPMAAVFNVAQAPQKALPSAPAVSPAQADAKSDAAPSSNPTDISALYQEAQTQTQNKALPLPGGTVQDASKSSLGTSTKIVTLGDDESTPDAAAAPVAVPAKAPAPVATPAASVALPAKTPVAAAPVPVAPVPAQVSKVESMPLARVPAAQGVSDIDGRVKAMGDEIKTLQTSLDNTLKQNEALLKKINEMSQQNDSSALAQRLSALEKKMADDKASAAAKPASTKAVAQPKETAAIALPDEPGALTSSIETEATPVKSEAPAIEPKTEAKAVKKTEAKAVASSKKNKAKAASSKETKKTAEAKEPKASTGGWILRAATPDAAWVSKGDYTAELRRVAVGETVPGLGKIKEIRQSGDSWEVVCGKGVLK